MGQERERRFPSRLIAPWPLLLGVAVSFATCCLAGRASGCFNCYRGLQRFHPRVDYQSLHYPTVAHVRAMARERLDPNRIVVVVGGNSVLYGSGVSLADSFAGRLQERLGDDYQVINLALCGATAGEFGATAAEVLSRDFPRLILIADSWPQLNCGDDPDGRPFARYFFWEARARGLLSRDPIREARLHDLVRWRIDAGFTEVRSQAALDATLSFRDLWTALECTAFSTTWCPQVAPAWWTPRNAYGNGESASGTAAPASALEPLAETQVAWLRGMLAGNRPLMHAAAPDDPTPSPRVTPLDSELAWCFPEACRKRTLMLVNYPNPYFVAKLTPAEQADYHALAGLSVATYERSGMAAVEVGGDYPASWYLDAVHMTRDGDDAMARAAAPRVRDLARRLGYAGAHE